MADMDTDTLDTDTDTHITVMEATDMVDTVARDPLMPTQLSSMVLPHTHTTHTVMDMPHTLMLHSQLPPESATNT